NEAAAALGRTTMTTSQPSRRPFRRARSSSRNRRRSRFRTTALPSRLLVEMPNRKAGPPVGQAWSTSRGCAQARPSPRTRRKSASEARRFSFRTAPASRATPGRSAPTRLDDGEPLPTLEPTALEHVAPRVRRHARAKPVLTLARKPFWLPGTLDQNVVPELISAARL